MAQDRAKQLLQQGIELTKAGRKDQAFQTFQQAVKLDPRNETIWLWLSSVARTDQERAFCLRQLLAINPNNELAIKGLKAMNIEPQHAQTAATPQADVPIVAKEKLANIQSALDDLIKNYRPTPYTPLEIEWVHKDRRRYGEGAARRLRSSVYLAGAAVVALIAAGLILLGLALLSGEDVGPLTVQRPTRTPTFTPTITLTPTPGVENTPFPEGVDIRASATPDPNLPRGNEYLLPTPTAIYPPLDIDISSQVRGVINLYNAGQYEQAASGAAQIREAQDQSCYQEIYFYNAVSLAKQGGQVRLNEAERLLADGLNAQRGAGFKNTCPDSALLRSGMCYVKYQQALEDDLGGTELGEAQDFCQRAHDQDPQLVFAAETLARIYLTRGDSTSLNNAFSVLDTTLNTRNNRGNLTLLLALADVEMARGRLEAALNYIDNALYVDPVSQEALGKRVEAYMLYAAQATPGSQTQLIRYGLAAIHAEIYLFYYPGSPEGHLLLAEARYREGNPDRALAPLGQLIAAESDLLTDHRQTYLQAYALRAEIYLARRDWENASADLERLVALDPDNPRWIEFQTTIALDSEEYEIALSNLELLLENDPTRSDLVIERARLLTRVCQYEDSFDCDHRLVVQNLLTDSFLESLPTDSPQQLDAESLRAEADFALLIEDEVDEDDEEAVAERNEALTRLFNQIDTVIDRRQTAEDYYLLARLLDEMQLNRQALTAYEWVAYWNQSYQYPFADAVTDAISRVIDEIEEETS